MPFDKFRRGDPYGINLSENETKFKNIKIGLIIQLLLPKIQISLKPRDNNVQKFDYFKHHGLLKYMSKENVGHGTRAIPGITNVFILTVLLLLYMSMYTSKNTRY